MPEALLTMRKQNVVHKKAGVYSFYTYVQKRHIGKELDHYSLHNEGCECRICFIFLCSNPGNGALTFAPPPNWAL